MSQTKSPRIPSYRLHKPSGRAVVRLNGKDFYLGKHGTTKSRNEYEKLIAEWLANNQQIRTRNESNLPSDLTVNELFLAYWKHAQTYYVKDGMPTSEQRLIKMAVRPLIELYGTTNVSLIKPLALKTVRQKMIDKDISLNVINKYISIIKRMFRWGSENELIEPNIYHGLQTVTNLRPGRSLARETAPVMPVPENDIDAVLPLLSSQVRAMVKLQLLTGMRPGEATQLRACDIDMSDKIWAYKPKSHKTQHKGRDRIIFFGPSSQMIIKPFLTNRLKDSYLFSPIEAVIEHKANRIANRKTPITPSQIKKGRKPIKINSFNDCYNKHSYRNAIRRACDKAGVQRWSPNQLRHNAATRLRKEYGLEAARTVLGHSSSVVTEVYAEIDQLKAADIMSKIG